MLTATDTIALLAIAISLISFWLSYRSARLSRLLSAAEKKTETYIVFFETLLQGQVLHSIVLGVQKQLNEFSNPSKNPSIEEARVIILHATDLLRIV